MLVEIKPSLVGRTSSCLAEPVVSLSRWYSTMYTVTTPTSGSMEMVTEVSMSSEKSGGIPEAGGKSTIMRRRRGRRGVAV